MRGFGEGVLVAISVAVFGVAACGGDDAGGRCEVVEAPGECLTAYAVGGPEPALPVDLLSDEALATCTEAEGGRDAAGDLTEAAATCIARALGLNEGTRPWRYQGPSETSREWSVDTELSRAADCCGTGCAVSLDAETGRPLRAGIYGHCP